MCGKGKASMLFLRTWGEKRCWFFLYYFINFWTWWFPGHSFRLGPLRELLHLPSAQSEQGETHFGTRFRCSSSAHGKLGGGAGTQEFSKFWSHRRSLRSAWSSGHQFWKRFLVCFGSLDLLIFVSKDNLH